MVPPSSSSQSHGGLIETVSGGSTQGGVAKALCLGARRRWATSKNKHTQMAKIGVSKSWIFFFKKNSNKSVEIMIYNKKKLKREFFDSLSCSLWYFWATKSPAKAFNPRTRKIKRKRRWKRDFSMIDERGRGFHFIEEDLGFRSNSVSLLW